MMRPRALPRGSRFVVGFGSGLRRIMETGFIRLKAETLENQGFYQTFKGWKMVGVMGFGPMTFWSRTKRATRLRYAPKDGRKYIRAGGRRQGDFPQVPHCRTIDALRTPGV